MRVGDHPATEVLSAAPTRLRRFASIVLVFLVVGPAIGWSAFTAGHILAEAATAGPRLPAPDMLLVTLLFGYLTGATPAVAAGLMIGWWCLRRTSLPSIWVAAAFCGVLGGLFGYALFFSSVFRSRPPQLIRWDTIFMLVAMSAIAGAVCTRLTRRWQ